MSSARSSGSGKEAGGKKPGRSGGSPRDAAALVAAAGEYAREQGWQVEDYVASAGEAEHDRMAVRFEGKSKLPGDHFTVIVQPSTGRALDLIPGR